MINRRQSRIDKGQFRKWPANKEDLTVLKGETLGEPQSQQPDPLD